ncbi:MAG: T9SS type A sorting domain-containing protein [Lewinella sp.]
MHHILPLFFLFCTALWSLPAHGQARLSATGESGSAYPVISDAGFNIEGPDDSSPDCVGDGPGNHSAFGDHILQAADADLGQNVFEFYSHLPEDNDRCLVFDRARIEIKGGPNGQSDPELEHEYGDTSYYRWQFRLADDFVGAGSFNHLFQNKAAGGSDSGFPILTLTARTSRVELLHNGGDDNPSGTLGRLSDAPLDRFTGHWVEVTMRQVHANDGALDVTIRDVETGLPILLYTTEDIDLWRGAPDEGGLINRPKWGIYRSYNEAAGLKDEVVRFANFCSSETALDACPSIIDLGDDAPEMATDVLPLDGSESVPLFMPIVWTGSAAATAYRVYLGSSPTELTLDTTLTTNSYHPELAAGTTYYFQVSSVNETGESRTAIQSFTTLQNPDDGNWDVARGHARPEVEAGQFFELNTNLTTLQIDSVARLNDREGNNAYCYFSGPKEGDNGNYRWRYRQEVEDETTVVVRLAALPDVNNITYVEFYGLGWRQKMRVNRSTIRFERTTEDPEVAFPEGYWDDGAVHTLRFTFQNNPMAGAPMITTVYLDEDPTAFGGPFESDEEKESAFIDIGRAGSTDYGACFDYIAINASGAYAPESVPASMLPVDLAGDAAVAVGRSLPLDGSVDVPLYMPIVWDGVDGADTYRVYLGTSADDLALDTTVATTSYVSELTAATTYYYQIASTNAQGETRGEVRQFTTLEQTDDGPWEVARGHARPEVEAPQFFEFDTNLEMVGLDSVGPIVEEAGNNAYCYFSGPKEGDNNNYRWRYRQDEGEETTVLIRLRALPETSNIAYVEFFGLGWRQKLRINRSTLKFERTVDDPEVNFPEGFWDDGAYRILRITFQDNPEAGQPMVTTVYLDEETTPFATYVSDESTDNTYLDIGRAGGTDYGACFDYMAVNPDGAFAPGAGEGMAPPADLMLPEPPSSVSHRVVFTPRLFPNPTSGRLQVNGLPSDEAYSYVVVSATGKQMSRGQLTASGRFIDVRALPSGVYFLQVRSSDGATGLSRFVRQ